MIKLGFVMDPIASINIKKDSSFAMLLEAQRRGYEIHYMEMNDLSLRGGVAFARTRLLSVEQNAASWYQFGSEQQIKLADLDVVLMRKDPPFDTEFIYCTYILERAEEQGTLIVNKPQSLRDCNENSLYRLVCRIYAGYAGDPFEAATPCILAGAWRCDYEAAGRHGWRIHLSREAR